MSDASLFLAQHSVYRGNGETDILALVDTSEGRVALMVEDKIGAEMQPRQAERYHERGAALCAEATAQSYKTLLVAPESYLRGIELSDWHKTVSFEKVAQWFGERGDVRARWRQETLVRAITRQRRSIAAVSVTDTVLANFKADYRAYATAKYKEFVFSEQRGRDKEYYFKARSFPSSMRLKHSFTASSVTLVCEQRWKDKAVPVLKDNLPDDVWTTLHGATLHVVTGTEPVDLSQPLESQTDLIDVAMEAARRLLPYAVMVQGAA